MIRRILLLLIVGVVLSCVSAEYVGDVFEEQTGKLLSKERIDVVTKSKAMGYGGFDSNYEIDGESSPFKISKVDTLVLKIKVPDSYVNVSPEQYIAVYKFKIKGKKKPVRYVNLSKIRGVGGVKNNNEGEVLFVDGEYMGGYKNISLVALEKGEYGVVTLSSLEKVYTFSIK